MCDGEAGEMEEQSGPYTADLETQQLWQEWEKPGVDTGAGAAQWGQWDQFFSLCGEKVTRVGADMEDWEMRVIGVHDVKVPKNQ